MTRKKLPPLPPISDEEEARIQKGIAEDPDNPEWTEDMFKKARPFTEVFPELAESIRRSRGRPRVEAPKQAVTLRLDPATIEKFKAGGDDWRTRMTKALDRAKG